MKKIKKLVMALAMIIAFSSIAPSFNIQTPFVDQVSAKIPKNNNIVVGCQFTYYKYKAKIKSVSYSKKGILSGKKLYKRGDTYQFTGKKAGTTKVTIKFKNNKKESFTVKVYPANTIKAELVSVDYKNFNFKFKNTSKCFFDILGFTFKLYDKNGKLLSSPYGAVQSLQPGSTAYYSFSNWDNIKKEDIAKVKCTIKSSSPLESKHKKYYEKKNHFTVNLTNNIESKTATVKIKNNTKKDLSIPCYLLYYKNNELVYTESIYFSIKAKKSDSSKQTNPYLDYDTVKYSVSAYNTTFY